MATKDWAFSMASLTFETPLHLAPSLHIFLHHTKSFPCRKSSRRLDTILLSVISLYRKSHYWILFIYSIFLVTVGLKGLVATYNIKASKVKQFANVKY